MPISTGEIVMLIFLALILGVATWWFVVAYQYRKTLNMFAYTRGANVDPGPGKSTGTVDMKCDSEREICVWRATAYCTGTNGVINNEIIPGAYSNGEKGNPIPYGGFDVVAKTGAVDLTSILSKTANGKESYTHKFDGGMAFAGKCVPRTSSETTRPQLIATYSCIPKGQKCTTWSGTV